MTDDRGRWQGMEGLVLPGPEWAADGLLRFRPDDGPILTDYIVPEGEIEWINPTDSRDKA